MLQPRSPSVSARFCVRLRRDFTLVGNPWIEIAQGGKYRKRSRGKPARSTAFVAPSMRSVKPLCLIGSQKNNARRSGAHEMLSRPMARCPPGRNSRTGMARKIKSAVTNTRHVFRALTASIARATVASLSWVTTSTSPSSPCSAASRMQPSKLST